MKLRGWLYVVGITLMILSFLISGLFFLSSGVVEDGEFNHERLVEVLVELDDMPFINIHTGDVFGGDELDIKE